MDYQEMVKLKLNLKWLLQEMDHQENCALAAACKTQVLKVKAMESRLLEQTYTALTLPALSAVAQHLEAAEEEVEAKHQQVILVFLSFQSSFEQILGS